MRQKHVFIDSQGGGVWEFFLFNCKAFEIDFLSFVTAWCQAEVLLQVDFKKCFKITRCEGWRVKRHYFILVVWSVDNPQKAVGMLSVTNSCMVLWEQQYLLFS